MIRSWSIQRLKVNKSSKSASWIIWNPDVLDPDISISRFEKNVPSLGCALALPIEAVGANTTPVPATPVCSSPLAAVNVSEVNPTVKAVFKIKSSTIVASL